MLRPPGRAQITALSILEQEVVVMLEQLGEKLADADECSVEPVRHRIEAARWLADHSSSFSWRVPAPARAAKHI